MPRVSVTHFTDPGCPWAWSASPHLAALQWRYGDQLEWRHVMIGLTEHASQYEARGYTPLMMARGQVRFRRFGMPFAPEPKDRVAGTSRGCRAVVAARLQAPERELAVLRALQFMQFTTTGVLDRDADLLEALRGVPGIDAEAVVAAIDSAEVLEAYEADRAEARTAAGGATEAQGKTASSDGPVRYTAPSLIFRLTGDGRADGPTSLEAGGFQSLMVYDAMLANLDPTLERRDPPQDVAEVLAAFPDGLTTAEVAAVYADGAAQETDKDLLEDRLVELAGERRATRVAKGDDALWLPGQAQRHGERAHAGRFATA
jgi:protein-disulfide isomerase-like protein with CxxC motif